MKRSSSETKKAPVSSKKIVITVLSVCIVFLILCGTYYLVSSLTRGKNKKNDEKIRFYSEQYSIDIMNDKSYLDLDRQFYFTDNAGGITVAITDEDAEEVPAAVRDAFICIRKYIQYAIAGDSGSLNRLYSDKYFANGGKEKGSFTEQKIYDIYISGKESEDRENSYEFTVEYKIRHNNGSFRDDMGSDCSKKEFFTVTDYNGNFRIDLIYTMKTVN